MKTYNMVIWLAVKVSRFGKNTIMNTPTNFMMMKSLDLLLYIILILFLSVFYFFF